jgi:hypothetical protein
MARLKIGGSPKASSGQIKPEKNIQEPTPKNTSGYFDRNLGHFVSDVYAGLRSGAGIGNVLQAYLKDRDAPESVKYGASWVLPSFGQAKQEYGQAQENITRAGQAMSLGNILQKSMSAAGVPEDNAFQQAARAITPEVTPATNFTQISPEDYRTQQALRTGLSAAAGAASGGGFVGAGIGALGYGLSGLGSTVGAEIGREGGALLGYPETGQEIGSLAGGWAGARYIPRKINEYRNRPSEKLLPKLRTAEQEKLANLGRVYEGEVTNIDDLYNKKSTELDKTHSARLDNFNTSVSTAMANVDTKFEPQIKAALDKVKNLTNAMTERDLQVEKLKKAQEPLWSEARAAETGEVGDPENIRFAIAEAKKSLGKAVLKQDVNLIADALSGLDADVKNSTMDIATSKLYAKRLNNIIYNKDVDNTVKDILIPIRDELYDFTADIGSEKHADIYNPARAATREYKKMKAEKKQFEIEQKRKIANAKLEVAELKRQKQLEIDKQKAKFKIEQERINRDQKIAAKRIAEEKKRALEKAELEHSRLLEAQKENIKRVNEVSKEVDTVAAAGYGAWLGKQFGMKALGAAIGVGNKILKSYKNQKAIIDLAMEINPQIALEFEALQRDLSKLAPQQIISMLNAIGQEIEQTIEEEKNKPIQSSKRRLKMGSR